MKNMQASSCHFYKHYVYKVDKAVSIPMFGWWKTLIYIRSLALGFRKGAEHSR